MRYHQPFFICLVFVSTYKTRKLLTILRGTTQTSSSGGGTNTTSGSGGGTNTTSGAGGGNNYTSTAVTLHPENVQSVDQGGIGGANHNHGIRDIVIDVINGNAIYSPFVASGAHIHPAHSHQVTLRDHQHDIHIRDHTHQINIPNHTHQITIPNHTHNIQHTHVIPPHKHDIEHAIYEGDRASSYVVDVDGNVVNGITAPRNDVDIVPFLRKDEEGRILRGWHEIRIRPRGQAKITAMVMVQTFVNSKGNITV